ncbi:MAG: hypothetical protein M3N52_11875 [Actinomycetota bacterium]|nr:hypothetical protein [Actinomycetota bacterium]
MSRVDGPPELGRMWSDMARRRRRTAVLVIVYAVAGATVLGGASDLSDWQFPEWWWLVFGNALLVAALLYGHRWADLRQREAESRTIWKYEQRIGAVEMDHMERWAEFHAERRRREAEQ